MNSQSEQTSIHQRVEQWLTQVVIGLNLCPFAAKPHKKKQIKIYISQAQQEEKLLEDLYQQFLELDSTPADQLETTLVVVPYFLSSFDDYNQFIDWIDALIMQHNWEGIYQVATFHPDYCFAGNRPEDDENLTNKSPYPIYHLIREESIEKVLARYPHPESIPENNIQRISTLTSEEKTRLFSYLMTTHKE
ncbi:DUF1415 domain-containing protein [Vibrio mangrovi]|uniref:DUF1415 domain-containing protein n=1 Tax=Vibrio mangrovi TaxID=474394 RepID=A0A1Y6IMT7_9VIBR|nr:DUF1415 domain-containing protein [Vibrio mangrovi]MDW6004226.1 DUF1415 domain-containing protein [Vibrio mangrovi]SMR98975.1 hypothetical protein VIM7927_00195 [Vibrio mangrovi]